jgi:hypothetical protein
VSETIRVSSSIASISCSGSTWTTRAPRASWACQIWPTVGNSSSVVTIFGRAAYRSPVAIALSPAETEVVTATSSGCAPTRPANAARAVSARSTQ